MDPVSFNNSLQYLSCPKSTSLNNTSVYFRGPMTPDRFTSMTQIDLSKIDLTRSSTTSTFDELA